MLTIKSNNHFSTLIFSDNLHFKGNLRLTNNNRNYILECANRARNQVLDYAFNNTFSHFITLTLDDKKIDWHDSNIVIKKITKQFNNYKNRIDPKFKYILIPEYGSKEFTARLHFHGLIYTDNFDILKYMFYDIKYNCIIYRNEWFYKNLGANQFIPINYDNGSVGKYISKYMGKQLNNNFFENFNRFYFCSKGLKKSNEVIKSLKNSSFESYIYFKYFVNNNNVFQNTYCTKVCISNEELEKIRGKINAITGRS